MYGITTSPAFTLAVIFLKNLSMSLPCLVRGTTLGIGDKEWVEDCNRRGGQSVGGDGVV